MGLFGLSKKEKEAWIAIVIQGKKSGMQIDEALLKNATDTYITQHIRILELYPLVIAYAGCPCRFAPINHFLGVIPVTFPVCHLPGDGRLELEVFE